MIYQKFIGADMLYWIRHCVVEVCALLSALDVVVVVVVCFSLFDPNIVYWICDSAFTWQPWLMRPLERVKNDFKKNSWILIRIFTKI